MNCQLVTYCCRYVIGGVRKKLNIEENLSSPITTAKSLPATPISKLPGNLRQISTTITNSEHRKIIPKSLSSDNMTSVLHNKATVLSNIIASKDTQATRSLLPPLIPTSVSQSSFNFNKIFNNQHKENMLSHLTTSKVNSFAVIPEAIQSLTHNKLLKVILPTGNQIFTSSATNEQKSLQCVTCTSNCSTSSNSVTLNANLLNLISYKNETSNANSQHQVHASEDSSKIICYWEDCKR